MSLVSKQARFAQHVALLLQFADSKGCEVTFGEAWRPPELAEIYAADGRGIKRSVHRKRLAVDLNFFERGRWLQETSELTMFGEFWESLGEFNRWGGRFKNRDAGHFSFEHGGVK